MLFRRFALVTLLLSATLPVMAQVHISSERDVVFFNHALPMQEEAVQKVQAAFNLSEVQVTAVKALLKMRDETTQGIFKEVEAAQQKLQETVSQRNPNPTEVGTAFLAARTVQERIGAAHEKFQTDFQALLNADQRAVLANLTTSASRIEALRQLGVLDGTAGSFQMALPAMAPLAGPGIRGGVRIERRTP